MNYDQIDADTLKKIVQRGKDLQTDNSRVDAKFDRMEQMYMLQDPAADALYEDVNNMVEVRSPDPATSIETMARVMASNTPGINASKDDNPDTDQDVLNRIEQMARISLYHSNRAAGGPVHRDMAKLGPLFGRIVVTTDLTADMVEYARRGKDAREIERAERTNRLTPVLFKVHHPKGWYFQQDMHGLRTSDRCVELTPAEIDAAFPVNGKEALTTYDGHYQSKQKLKVWISHDLDWYVARVENCKQIIDSKPWGYTTLPMVTHDVGGSGQFSKPEDRLRPILDLADRSGLWVAQNVSLTQIFTAARIAAILQFIYETQHPETSKVELDFTQLAGVATIPDGDKLTQLVTQLDPKSLAAWELSSGLLEQTTIYKQVAGQALGAGATFSETALLNQAGRLSLADIALMMEWTLADMVQTALQLMREHKGTYGARNGGERVDVAADEIPEDLIITVKLDPALPQDKVGATAAAKNAVDSGLVSARYVREEILNVENPDQMQEEIDREQLRGYFKQLTIAEIEQVLAQMKAPPAAPANPAQPPDTNPAGVTQAQMDGGMGGPMTPASEQGMQQLQEPPA
jgi:hypothetical protein